MILCSCGNDIEYFIAVAQQDNDGRYIIISNGAYFACIDCKDKILKRWQDHNNNRTVKYLIYTAKVSVKTDTKKEFERRVLPQIITQFNMLNCYVPKTDIQNALKGTTKGQ
jgi:hypothetical protein